jgi:hypothetical protein
LPSSGLLTPGTTLEIHNLEAGGVCGDKLTVVGRQDGGRLRCGCILALT